MFKGILILAVRHNRTRTVFSRNAETTLHHCKTYVVFMHNMHPVAKSIDEMQCSHFSMDPKQIKSLFLPMRLQTTDTACTRQTDRQTDSKVRCHDTDCTTSKDTSVAIRANCSDSL
jgi:hypothetical protein